MFYLLSRVSQIYKNWSRGATEGLSLHMFGAIVTANLLYVAGILVRADALSDVTTAAPWLLGTVGTIFLDMTIFYQVPPCSLSSPCSLLLHGNASWLRLCKHLRPLLCCLKNTSTISSLLDDGRASSRCLHPTRMHATDHYHLVEMVGIMWG